MKPKSYNLDYLRELSSGDKDFERSMLDYFVSNTPEVVKTMDRLLIQEDWGEIREVIHRFIPNLNMVGAGAIIDDANKIEMFTEKRIHLEQVPQLWEHIRNLSAELVDEIRNDFND